MLRIGVYSILDGERKTQVWKLWIKGQFIQDFPGKREVAFKEIEAVIYKYIFK